MNYIAITKTPKPQNPKTPTEIKFSLRLLLNILRLDRFDRAMNRGFKGGQRAYQSFQSKSTFFKAFPKQTQAAHFSTINTQL